MSTANFRTMKEFPLYVLPDAVSLVCPECGEPMEEDECVCPACGCESSPEPVPDYWEGEYIRCRLQAALDDFNAGLTFFQVSLESGYYTGAQFYVEEMEDSPADLDNAACRYTWDLCRSVAIRQRERERRKVCRWMQNTAAEWGMEQLVCVGRFSNGEAIYKHADAARASLLAACSGIEQHTEAPREISLNLRGTSAKTLA